MVGTTISHYKVLEKIGEGGMGEVYRATDTKLNRDVALKILPQQFASDAQRMGRFQREAEVLASLDHPNIGQIYGIEDAGHTKALVLQLIEGPTLADKIAQGPIAIEEALKIALQIAEGVEAAHEKGVIHRDLKPANIKITPEGQVKILDFGLAKAMEGEVPASSLSQSPTLTNAATQAGVILGTAAYMSPEQARGEATDKKADIWAFGVILIEMLTGRQAFAGPTVSESLAKVLEREPPFEALPPDTPSNIRLLLERCLRKDSRLRLQHMGDARIEMSEAPEPAVADSKSAAPVRWMLATAVALLLAVILATLMLLRPDAMSPLEVTRFKIQSVTGDHIATTAPLALSPDGRRLVYGVGDQVNIDNSGRLVLHELESGEGHLLEGLPDAGHSFFAPGNDLIGFATTSGALQQLSLLGGTPTPLVNLSNASMGASWGTRGTIVSSGDWGEPLFLTLLENGGNTEVLTTLDSEAREGAHLWPQILPGNRAALFTIWIPAPSLDESLLAVVDLQTGEHRLLSERGVFGRYATSGHLIFWRGGALMAAPFDLDTLSVTGDAKTVVEGVRLNGGDYAAHYTISDSGTLAYVSGKLDFFVESSIVDRSGNILSRLDDTVAASDPAFSSDGRQVALTVHRSAIFDIAVYDLDRETLTFFPTEGDNLRPSWTHDGDRITYLSNADGAYNHYSINSGGAAEAQPLFAEPHGTCCRNRAAWSPLDQHVVVSVTADGGGQADWDLWILSSDSETSFEPLFTERGNQLMPAFSPNGRWIAYESIESNVTEVWLRPFPDVQLGRRKVSVSEGNYPVWNPNGEEILYLTEDGIMSVAILDDSGTLPTLGQEQLILDMTGIESFAISPNGQTFAVRRFPEESAPREINIVLNWFEELKARVPVP